MAAPQTHGLIDLVVFGIFILLSALGLAGKISLAEYLSGIFWGMMIDLDHLLYWKYVKDIPARIFKRGGGGPADDIKPFPSWLHLWPGLILVLAWGFFFHSINSSFRVWFPFVFWLIHRTIDRFQRSDGKYPHYPLLYPIIKKLFYRKRGYSIKSPAEFILDSTILLFTCFILLGLLLLLR